jgi:hypothetical protein
MRGMRASLSQILEIRPLALSNHFMCDPIIRKDSIVPAFSCNISEASQPGPDIGPKQSINLIGPIIQDSEMDATEKEEKFIYVLGGISYTDNTTITENAEPRITKFCQRIQKTNKAPEPTRPPGAIAPPAGESPTAMQTQIFAVYTCPGYNCVDMGCK